MAKLADGVTEDAAQFKRDGVEVVKSLTLVGQTLFPLRQKKEAGKKLTKRETGQLEALESQYAELEAALREMMRPRQRPVL